MKGRYGISTLALISSGLAAMFGTDAIGFPPLAGPRTGNQRGAALRAAQYGRQGVSGTRYQALKSNTTTYLNPKRNAERKAYRAERAANRLYGTKPYQQKGFRFYRDFMAARQEHAHG